MKAILSRPETFNEQAADCLQNLTIRKKGEEDRNRHTTHICRSQPKKTTMPFNFHPKIDPKEWNALDHDHQKWNVLDGHAREAACMLGYTQEEWDSGKITHLLETKDWSDLDAPQRDAAKVVGFDQDTWSRVFTSIHEQKHTKHPDDEEPDYGFVYTLFEK